MYSRGSVWYYQTYPGMYIPRPIELRVVKSEVSPMLIAREALGLTKMNWNNTQFDGKYPVTLGCARKVGEVMKYLTDSETPQIRYGFYM
jgi:argonaute-like protein implicated in RNA metabolism and viral defense